MNESIAVAKEADAKKRSSSTHESDERIHRAQNESERQLGALGDVIGNIMRDDAEPSAESIATELGGRSATERAPALLALQQTHGNRYVQRVVAGIQAKLKVGQPGDKYEQEADRVADVVMRMPEPGVQRQVEPEEEEEKKKKEEEEEEELIQTKPLAEQITQLVQMQVEEEEEEEEILRTKGRPGQTPEIIPALESRIQSLRGGGQPLPESVRTYFEPRFGYDLSQVRIHSNTEGAHLARKLNAKAFTTGSNIVFGSGQYSPGSSRGKQLLAHELTHVMQQSKERSLKKEPNVDKGLRVNRANSMEIRLKDIKVGDPELPEKKDLDFTIATVLGEASPTGPISEKLGIAMVLKRRVEEKLKGKSTFKDIILNTGVYGNPTLSALSRLAELYLNKKANNLNEFQQLVDKVKDLRKSDRDYLKTNGGFKTFVERIEQAKMATEFVLAEAKFEPNLETISKEATWWGGEIDLWNAKTGKFRRHGIRVAKNELVFVVYQEVGKTYFLKTAASIKNEAARYKQIERSKKLLCDELERNTKWTKEEIEKNNPDVCQGLSTSATRIQRAVEGDITQMGITEDWARNLNDNELEEQTNIVRNQLLTLEPTTPEHDAARQNLRILEAEAARRLGPSATTDGIFSIKSSAGSTVRRGTYVTYSVIQIYPTMISQESAYHYLWSVENDPTTYAIYVKTTPDLKLNIEGPKDKKEWTLLAVFPGKHLIKVKILLNDSPISNLAFEQTVTDDGRSIIHKEIIKMASQTKVDKDVKEWNTWDIAKWKFPVLGDPNYIHDFKRQWVRGYRDVIKAAACQFDLPEILVGGVAYVEVGGDPLWIDDIAYEIREFDHAADPVLEPLTITKEPEKTSFGNVSIQIRRAAEALGYEPEKLSDEQEKMIIDSLKDPKQNIFISAKHLADLRDVDFKGKSAGQMTLEDIMVTAARYNRGPELGIEEIKSNMSYGEFIIKKFAELYRLLYD